MIRRNRIPSKLALLALLAMLGLWQSPAQAAAVAAPHHIDFSISFNMQTGEPDFKDGFGLWLGYRYSLNAQFSLGAKAGWHTMPVEVESLGTKDTASGIPVLLTGQIDHRLPNNIRLFGQLGLGVSFNTISGDLTDLIDLKIDPSLAIDLAAGVVYEINPNAGIGLVVDWFISNPSVDSTASIDDSVDIGHVGIGLQFTGTF